jgi:predicted membrane protein
MTAASDIAPTRLHWPALLMAIGIMLLGTAFPMLFARPDGRADHTVAMLAFWAMSAGFVRGVGFIPRHAVPRLLLSAPAASLALMLAVVQGVRNSVIG